MSGWPLVDDDDPKMRLLAGLMLATGVYWLIAPMVGLADKLIDDILEPLMISRKDEPCTCGNVATRDVKMSGISVLPLCDECWEALP